MVGWVVGGRQKGERTTRTGTGSKGPRTEPAGTRRKGSRVTAGRRCGACAFSMGAGGRCAASPANYTKGCNNNCCCCCCCNYSASQYTTTSFNEYYILDFYLSRSCANNCYLILRNWGKTQDILSLLETTPHFSTPSQKKTFSSTPIQQETAKDLSEDEIRPYSCGILNRNDNTEYILTGYA